MIPRSLPGIAALAMIGLVPTAGPAQAKSLNIDAFVQQWGSIAIITAPSIGGSSAPR